MKLNTIQILVIVVLALGVAFLIANVADKEVNTGSVGVSSEYFSTTTVSTSAGTHWLARGGSCTFGSVVVASSSATTLTLWNATSTTDSASTTIATLKAAISEGTFTFDTVCDRGLVVETPTGFNGVYVVTYR